MTYPSGKKYIKSSTIKYCNLSYGSKQIHYYPEKLWANLASEDQSAVLLFLKTLRMTMTSLRRECKPNQQVSRWLRGFKKTEIPLWILQ